MTDILDQKINKELSPLRLIRLAQDLKSEEMAELLNCSNAYISAIESGDRTLKGKKLEEKLAMLNISMDDYLILYKYLLRLQNANLSQYTTFALALMKTIGIVYPELRSKADNLSHIPRKKSSLEEVEQQEGKNKTLERQYITIHTIYR